VFPAAPMMARRVPAIPEEHGLACLPGCSLCCSYTVLVTEAERELLQSAASSLGVHDPFVQAIEGGWALRRRQDFCVFLDREYRCAVYDHRPRQCREYPTLRTSFYGTELDADLSCPALDPAERRRQARRSCTMDNGGHATWTDDAMCELHNMLRAHKRYTSPETLLATGERYLDRLGESWTVTQPAGASTLRVSGGGCDPDDQFGLTSAGECLNDTHRVARHFGKPHWNTRKSPGHNEVSLYLFWLSDGIIQVQEKGTSATATPTENIGQTGWLHAALAVRKEYLSGWLTRQLLQRLAFNLAVAGLWRGSDLNTCYLMVLSEIDWRLMALSPALALHYGKEVVDTDIVREAIRGSDGLLLAWCQSARLGTTPEC
jgi:Fe-S-cluster containining protein